jgi:tRNA threonylcarbamoyladenosine biosynthesis protein TsaB
VIRVLALETSSISYGAAVSGGASRTLRRDDPSFTGLADLVASLDVDVAALDAVAVDIGPGNLASVRSGVAYANGLAFALRKPIFAASSLELLALEAGGPDALCLRDAGQRNVYALFNGVLRHGPLTEVVPALVGGCPAVGVAGVYRAEVAALLPDVAVKDSGLDAPRVSTLLRAFDPARLVAVASPLTEASPEFAS